MTEDKYSLYTLRRQDAVNDVLHTQQLSESSDALNAMFYLFRI